MAITLDKIKLVTYESLLHAIYSDIRIITIQFEKNAKRLLLKIYLNRQPDSLDEENLSQIIKKINISLNDENINCIGKISYSDLSKKELIETAILIYAKKEIPPSYSEISSSVCSGTIGEIYPAIRQLCFQYSQNERSLKLRIYLDRNPKESDYETARLISGHVFGDYWQFFESISEECIYSTEPGNKLDPLDGILYARREYDLDEVL